MLAERRYFCCQVQKPTMGVELQRSVLKCSEMPLKFVDLIVWTILDIRCCPHAWLHYIRRIYSELAKEAF